MFSLKPILAPVVIGVLIGIRLDKFLQNERKGRALIISTITSVAFIAIEHFVSRNAALGASLGTFFLIAHMIYNDKKFTTDKKSLPIFLMLSVLGGTISHRIWK